ncbi:hypothetical protein [uncultured Sulfitobacter sp.]|uniref:hypothetical protein n=1 Tax=uncultured Sulfitobacter sp. TaxID=191468 RepID=UPI00261ABB1A|nr:hypothetical protein [uncultured Sulfitobacter sp.]
MTNEMFIGGLMILMMVAVIVVAMTSVNRTDHNRFDEDHTPRKDRDSHRPKKGRR